VLSVEFGRQGQRNTGPVNVIEFFGNRESAPSEIPYLSKLSVADVVRKYGEPISRVPMAEGTTYLWFRNGIVVGARDDKVYRYGIFDYHMIGNRWLRQAPSVASSRDFVAERYSEDARPKRCLFHDELVGAGESGGV
jgi:hypothetical protein